MKKTVTIIFILINLINISVAQSLKGTVIGNVDSLPLAGIYVRLQGSTTVATITDINGQYILKSVPTGKEQNIEFSSIGYKTVIKTVSIKSGETTTLNVEMYEDVLMADQATVVARRKRNNESAIVSDIKQSSVVVSGISASQISKTADSDAGEVVKRIPGISLVDNRFIIVRGLSQRYNNVWINGGAVPSTEADGRAFSFDMVPSSQIDNILIVKSPSPELPADFSGGFIKISTKDVPEKSSVTIGVSTGVNTVTHSHNTRLPKSSSTDWLGIDNSMRTLSKDFPAHLGAVTSPDEITKFTKNGFNNDWTIKEFRPLPDIKANISWNAIVSEKVSMSLSVGYSNTYKSLLGVQNTRYGIYNHSLDKASVEKNYTDNQYNNDVKLNAMNNWVFRLNNFNRIEFRNLFNIIGKNRLTERYGVSSVSGDYYENQTEMRYNSRLTYTGQLAGKHTLGSDRSNQLDWNATYSFANKNEPDRRIVNNLGPIPADGNITPNVPAYNDNIRRFFQNLNDNIVSANVDYKKIFSGKNWEPEIKAGLYGEYRTRDYNPREFIYRYDHLSNDVRSQYIWLPFQEMMSQQWLGYDKVYADETTRKSNAYNGTNSIAAAYVATNLPLGKLNIYVGARAEYWDMSITYDRAVSASQQLITTDRHSRLSILPSVNMTYNFNDKHLLRLAYGRSVNRPEFREVSPSVYYDFDLFAEIQGNPKLEMATVENVDLRWEFYPSQGQMISVGAFYKHFTNPIEWNFVDMGGSYRYSYENAASAYTAGIEVDIRKSLDFIGVPDLSLVFNGSLVMSEVKFKEGSLVTERNRPLQGQSPYIVNAGLYYASEDLGLSASVLYNIIGKRIIGVGKSTSVIGNSDYDIPDSYEMPRNVLDISVAKKIGKIVELKFTAKDILNEPFTFKQFPTTTVDSKQQSREQITMSYRQGVSFSLGLVLKF